MKRRFSSVAHLSTSFLAGSISLIMILMPYHAFLSTWLGTSIGPLLLFKSWKEIVLLVMVVVAMGLGFSRPAVAAQVLKSPLTITIFAYALVHVLVALFFWHPLEPTLAGLMFNLRFLAFFVLAQLVLDAAPLPAKKVRQFLTTALLVSTAMVSALAILQVLLLPPNFLELFGYAKDATIAPFILLDDQAGMLRAFATLRGPNALGQFLLLPLALLVVLLWRREISFKVGMPLAGLTAAALMLSGSRSAWLGAAAALVVVAVVLWGKMDVLQFGRRYGLVVAACIAAVILLAFEYPPLRLAIFHSSPGDATLTEGSTDKHLAAAITGAEAVLNQPLGYGPGQAGPASFYTSSPRLSENYYLQIAEEVGLLGLGLFVTILVLVGRGLWQRLSQHAPPLTIALFASFCGIAIINFFLHGWADDPSALVWWGLAGLALGPQNPEDI